MKKQLLLLFLLAWLPLFSFDGAKLFVGYINDRPVFDCYEEHKLYILKDKPEFLQDYPKKYTPVAVKDDCIVYQTDYSLIVVLNGAEAVYKDFSCYVAIDTNGTVYATSKDGKSIKILKSGTVTDTGLKGYVLSVQDGYLYYTDEHDPEIVHANADLFKVDINTLKDAEKIALNISGEKTVVFPGGAYVYDDIIYKRSFAPVILSVADNKYQVLKITGRFSEATPFYSIADKCLVFYNPNDLSLMQVPLPTRFPFDR